MSENQGTPWIGEAKLSKDDYRVEAVADGKQLKVVVLHKEEEKLRVEVAQNLLDAKRKEGGRPLNAQALQTLMVLLIQTFTPSLETLHSEALERVDAQQAQLLTLFLRELAVVYSQPEPPSSESFARSFVQVVGEERATLFITMPRDRIPAAIEELGETDSVVRGLRTERATVYWNDVYSEIKKIVLPAVPS